MSEITTERVPASDLKVGDWVIDEPEFAGLAMQVSRIDPTELRLREEHWLCECPMTPNGRISCDPGTHERLDDIVLDIPTTPSTLWTRVHGYAR